MERFYVLRKLCQVFFFLTYVIFSKTMFDSLL